MKEKGKERKIWKKNNRKIQQIKENERKKERKKRKNERDEKRIPPAAFCSFGMMQRIKCGEVALKVAIRFSTCS